MSESEFDEQAAENLRAGGDKRMAFFSFMNEKVGQQMRTEESGDSFGGGLAWVHEHCAEATLDYVEYFFLGLPEKAQRRFSGLVTKLGYDIEKAREERVKAHTDKVVGDFVKSGGLEDFFEKKLESMKQEAERKQELLDLLKKAEEDRKKKSWVRRLFS